MDTFKLTRLLAKKSTICIDNFEFSRRVNGEHLFCSFDEAMDYLETVIINNSALNPADPFFVSYEDKPVLMINIVDEAVSTIIFAVSSYTFHRDYDSLGYVEHRVDEFNDSIRNFSDADKVRIPFYTALFNMMEHIHNYAIPVDHHLTGGQYEEVDFGKLSRAYYYLMYEMFNLAKPYGDYEHFNKYKKYFDSKRYLYT